MGIKARPTRTPDAKAQQPAIDLLTLLDAPWTDTTRPSALYENHVSAAPRTYASLIVAGLQHGEKKVRNGCAELASLLSEEYPETLYDQTDLFFANLASKEAILRWEAVCTLGNLARVDRDKRICSQLPMLYGFLSNKSIVLQGHAVKALAKIATAFPAFAEEILRALLEASGAFPGNRVGYVVEAMAAFLAVPESTGPGLANAARSFVEEHAQSSVKSVATKARRVLKQA